MKTKEIIARLRTNGDDEAANRMEQLLTQLTKTEQLLEKVGQERDAIEANYLDLTYKIQKFIDDISY